MTTLIQLDRERPLRYGMRALSMAEGKLGYTIAGLDMSRISFRDMAVLLWAGLWREDNSLTVEKVMDLVDEYSTVGQAFDAVGKAIELAMSPPDEVDEKNA